jgi:hypothetical protein
LTRAARIFYVLAALITIGSLLLAIFALTGDHSVNLFRLVINLLFAGAAYATGRGIDNQKVWAKRVGYILGALELLNFPIGTIIGIAILVYIHRASKAGLFSARAASAA